MWTGGLYCSMRCPDVLTMMTLIRVVNAPGRTRSECSSPSFLLWLLKPNGLTLSCHSIIDVTRGGGCVINQFLYTLLTRRISPSLGNVLFVARMNSWINNLGAVHGHVFLVSFPQVKVVRHEERENTNTPPVVFCMLTGLQYVDRVSHHSLEHV